MQQIREDSTIMVALSGGGHRATLFGIGVLLALVDLGLNRRVVQIASVSGGSITNAFVALRCQFEKETPQSFDRVAKELVSTVVKRGVLTKPWLAALVASIALPPLLFVLACFVGIVLPLKVTLPLLILWLTLVLLRGLVVEKLLSARYFRYNGRRSCFEDLKAEAVEHVICSTDLTHGTPCYFSSWEHGRVYVRTGDLMLGYKIGVRRLIPKLPLEVAVRASVGFPGIPPKRLPLGRFEEEPKKSLTSGGAVPPEPEAVLPAPTVFLADGGVWNNVATQPLLEDRFFRGKENAHGMASIAFVANGSAALDSVRSWPFCVPGWAEIQALLRVAKIQNINTVAPRVENNQRSLHDDVVDDRTPTTKKPGVIIVDISKSPEDACLEWSKTFSEVDTSPWHSQARRDWQAKLATDLGKWFQDAEAKGQEPDLNDIHTRLYDAMMNEPPRRKAEGRDRLDELKSYSFFSRLCELSEGALAKVPTTLDRIPKAIAAALLARGYANTIATAYAFELIDLGELLLANLTKERLEELTS